MIKLPPALENLIQEYDDDGDNQRRGGFGDGVNAAAAELLPLIEQAEKALRADNHQANTSVCHGCDALASIKEKLG